MNGEQDPLSPVAATENVSRNQLREVRSRRLLRRFVYLLLVTLLAINAWITWKSLAAQASGKVEHHFWVLCHGNTTDQQRREAFTELLKAGNREWRSARLANLNLERGEFDGVSLEYAHMKGCDFTGSTMAGASLRKTDLQTARLVRVDLTGASLNEASLPKADLTDSNLSGADLRSALLSQADLKNTNCEGANLAEANLLLAVLTGVNLRNADLSWSNLEAADLRGANLEGANLESASIRDTSFVDANWWRAVGLSSGTIEHLKQDFPPTGQAPPELQEDYQKWLQQ